MRRHLGMKHGELVGKPYAEFWNPHLAPLPEAATAALARGPLPPRLLPPVTEVGRLLEPGDQEIENGIALLSDGALHLALRTPMPDVTPAMIDWWFGWHSAEPQRYKLWHPEAHVHAAWAEVDPPGRQGRSRYVGRTSLVDEFVGTREGCYAIHFIAPSALGMVGPALDDPMQATAICARVGFAAYPVDIGYLVHHVRAVPGGSEMRSRFWIGGRYAGSRHGNTVIDLAARAARLVMRPPREALLIHCAEEMAHLASFLPALYARCRDLH